MKQKVGFIGLGTMGYPMSMNIIKAGYSLAAYDNDPAALEAVEKEGAKGYNYPREVAAESDVVITMLPNSAVVEDVVLGEYGVLEGLTSEKVLIDMSSSQPSSTRMLAKTLGKKDISMLDAPVSGGPPGATEATLSIMVGGEEKTFKQCLPLLKTMGDKLFYVGEAGAGHVAKAINNLLFGTTLAAACEAITLGTKAGIAPEKLVEIISASSGRCYAVDKKFPNIVFPRHFKPGFTTDLLAKDLDIALNLANELNVPTSVCCVAQQLYKTAQQKGFGSEDNTAAIKILEEIVKVEVKPMAENLETKIS